MIGIYTFLNLYVYKILSRVNLFRPGTMDGVVTVSNFPVQIIPVIPQTTISDIT